MSVQHLHEHAADLLDLGGHRYTSGRRRIVGALVEADGPTSVLDLIERGVGVSPSSLYRNLAVLERAGVVDRVVDLDRQARFEPGEAITRRPHHHFICEQCGVVGEFELADETESALRRALVRIASVTRFRIDSQRLDLFGTCSACP
ncbi:MAG: Fur family transcriptional regulator [Ilumatobacter sp.]